MLTRIAHLGQVDGLKIGGWRALASGRRLWFFGLLRTTLVLALPGLVRTVVFTRTAGLVRLVRFLAGFVWVGRLFGFVWLLLRAGVATGLVRWGLLGLARVVRLCMTPMRTRRWRAQGLSRGRGGSRHQCGGLSTGHGRFASSLLRRRKDGETHGRREAPRDADT